MVDVKEMEKAVNEVVEAKEQLVEVFTEAKAGNAADKEAIQELEDQLTAIHEEQVTATDLEAAKALKKRADETKEGLELSVSVSAARKAERAAAIKEAAVKVFKAHKEAKSAHYKHVTLTKKSVFINSLETEQERLRKIEKTLNAAHDYARAALMQQGIITQGMSSFRTDEGDHFHMSAVSLHTDLTTVFDRHELRILR